MPSWGGKVPQSRAVVRMSEVLSDGHLAKVIDAGGLAPSLEGFGLQLYFSCQEGL